MTEKISDGRLDVMVDHVAHAVVSTSDAYVLDPLNDGLGYAWYDAVELLSALRELREHRARESRDQERIQELEALLGPVVTAFAVAEESRVKFTDAYSEAVARADVAENRIDMALEYVHRGGDEIERIYAILDGEYDGSDS